MSESYEQQSSEQVIATTQHLLSPLQRNIRETMNNGELECIAWTQSAEESLDDTVVFPSGTKVFHCTNNSIADPHHWLEIELPFKNEKLTLIWDDTQQKMKGKSIFEKSTAIWSGYTDKHLQRVQVYPEFEE